jgi:hypothetical protein
MSPGITVAIITATVSMVGWVLNHILNSLFEKRKARLVAQLAHIERQLSELYGPLAFLIHEGKATFSDLLQNLGRSYIFHNEDPLPEDELATWLFWVEFDFMPRNSRIQSILASNTHLIAGERLPISYLKFLDHYNSWRVTHERWKRDAVEYSWHSKENWPKDFENDIISTFRQLMQTHAKLIGAVGRV